jgi:hypothetical protein
LSFSSFRILPILALTTFAGAMSAASITNGSFESPSVGTAYGTFTSIPGWTSSIGAIELDYTPVIGGGTAAEDGTQSTELNSSGYQVLSQLVTGLTVGQSYTLSYYYGDRPGADGTESMTTYFGTAPSTGFVTTDSSPETTDALVWELNTFTVTATATSEYLSFASDMGSGDTSYGNEIDNVSLVTTPEPSAFLLSLTGVAMGLFAAYRMRRLNA